MPAITDPDSVNFSFVPLDRVAQDGDIVATNRWWIIHPNRGLAILYSASYQCHENEGIVRRMAQIYPWAEVRFVELAYIPHNCQDFV